MQFNIISSDQFKTLPWKNGKGSTKELLVEKHGDGELFNWRLSMAPVTSDGMFSDFSGYHRNLILIEGKGIDLVHSGGQQDRLRQRFDMASFDGAWSTGSRLLDGKITDFNVMTRQGYCSAKVNIFREPGKHKLVVAADHLLVYPLESVIEIIQDENINLELAATSLLHCTSPPAGSWNIKGGAVICVQISYQKGG